jgi:hypothetical protein
MAVEAHVSSMKTSRSGSSSGWASNHASCRLRTSGRSGSAAWAVFFARDPVATEEAPQRAEAGADTMPGERRPQFLDRLVAGRLDETQDERRVALDHLRTAVAAERLRPRRPRLARPLAPAADARRADPEARGRRAVRQTRRHRRQHPNPQIDRQRFRHARRPPHPGGQFEPSKARFGNPIPSARIML